MKTEMNTVKVRKTEELEAEQLGAHIGEIVRLHGSIYKIRKMSSFAFVLLRTKRQMVQCVYEPAYARFALEELKEEACVRFTAEVIREERSRSGYDLHLLDVEILSEPEEVPPVVINQKRVNTSIENLLDYRPITLRNEKERAVFQIQARICQAFREFLDGQHFTEIHTPKLVAAGAEGGAELFKVQYFDRPAYLAQSPQLYKQILMSTGLDRVYEIGPAFRAEQSNTNRHVTEFISFDGEMSWIQSQNDVMAMIEEIVDHVLRGLKERGAKQLEVLGKEINVPARPYPILTYSECLKMVNDAGLKLNEGDDLGTEGEKIVGDVMGQKGIDLYFIAEYPEEAKPFYIMEKDGTPYSYSFDLDYRGQEVSSGGQREHRYDVLVKRMEKKGLDPEDFEFYLEAFRYGMPPHGGWGIGIERFLVKMLDLPNIREAILFPRDPSRLEP